MLAIKMCDIRALDEKNEFYDWKTWFFGIVTEKLDS